MVINIGFKKRGRWAVDGGNFPKAVEVTAEEKKKKGGMKAWEMEERWKEAGNGDARCVCEKAVQ